MSDSKMREEFERTNARDHRRQPPKGNNYIDPMAQADWDSFQKGWLQSRAALVVQVPDSDFAESWMDAIEAAGVKVKI